MGKSLDADWSAIQTAYLQGVSVPTIAKEFGVLEVTIRKRAVRNSWTQIRDRNRLILQQPTIIQVQARAAKWVSGMTTIAERYLAELQAKSESKPISLKELDILSKIASEVDILGRRSLGLDAQPHSAPIVQVAIQVNPPKPSSPVFVHTEDNPVSTPSSGNQVIEVEELPERTRE
jgi:hypothetical protein